MRPPIWLRWTPVLGVLLVLGLSLWGVRWPGGGFGASLLGGLAVVAFVLVWRRSSARVEHALGALERARVELRGDEGPLEQSGNWGDLLREIEERSREAKRREADLRRRLGQLSLAHETLMEGVLIFDEELRLLDANAAGARILDLDADATGRPLLELTRHPELEEVGRAALERGASYERQIELLSSHGGRRILHVHAEPLAAESGTEAIIVLQDLTDLRQLETVRRDFVTALSHELRTPLTAIRGYTETLASDPGSSEQREQFAAVILRNTERLEQLLEDLMLLSRTESGQLPLEPAPLDPGDVVRSVLRELAGRFEGAKLSIDVQEDSPPSTARADRRALEHVVLNLIDNAIKYTPAGGAVNVRIRNEGPRVCLEVADTGVGIPSKDLDRVFERFYRVDPARSREVGGTGLGLAIVRHLVEQMGGVVSVESEVGRGSTFTVRLPV